MQMHAGSKQRHGSSLVHVSQIVNFLLQLLPPRPALLHICLVCCLRRLAGGRCFLVCLTARNLQRLHSDDTCS